MNSGGKAPQPAVGSVTVSGLLTSNSPEVGIMKRSIHIEAPVEKVFDFFKDPQYVQ